MVRVDAGTRGIGRDSDPRRTGFDARTRGRVTGARAPARLHARIPHASPRAAEVLKSAARVTHYLRGTHTVEARALRQQRVSRVTPLADRRGAVPSPAPRHAKRYVTVPPRVRSRPCQPHTGQRRDGRVVRTHALTSGRRRTNDGGSRTPSDLGGRRARGVQSDRGVGGRSRRRAEVARSRGGRGSASPRGQWQCHAMRRVRFDTRKI